MSYITSSSLPASVYLPQLTQATPINILLHVECLLVEKKRSFLHGSSSCIPNRCPSHLTLPISISSTMSSTSHSAQSSLLCLVLHTSISLTRHLKTARCLKSSGSDCALKQRHDPNGIGEVDTCHYLVSTKLFWGIHLLTVAVGNIFSFSSVVATPWMLFRGLRNASTAIWTLELVSIAW